MATTRRASNSMSARQLERLSELLARFSESTQDEEGELRDQISRVRFAVHEQGLTLLRTPRRQ